MKSENYSSVSSDRQVCELLLKVKEKNKLFKCYLIWGRTSAVDCQQEKPNFKSENSEFLPSVCYWIQSLIWTEELFFRDSDTNVYIRAVDESKKKTKHSFIVIFPKVCAGFWLKLRRLVKLKFFYIFLTTVVIKILKSSSVKEDNRHQNWNKKPPLKSSSISLSPSHSLLFTFLINRTGSF